MFPPIGELVPHAPPALMLDEVLEHRPGRLCAARTIVATDPFVRDSALDAVVTLEHMGQAVAACLGLQARAAGGAVRVGMIVGVRRFSIARPRLTVGERLVVAVECLRGNDSVSTFAGEVRDAGGEPVSAATMTVVHGARAAGAGP